MDLQQSLRISAAGLTAQSVRMRIIAENLANSDTVAPDPLTDPYRRKIVSFRNELDRSLGVNTVQAKRVVQDQSDFGETYDPGNPAANEDGYVRTTNVNSLIETMDMQQASRSYKANITAIEAARRMASETVFLMRR